LIETMRFPRHLPVIALLAMAVSCGQTTPADEPDPADHPDVAEVRCSRDGSTEIRTPIVQAQANGVHIDVRVPAHADLAFIVKESGGRNAEDGPFVFAVPPGRIHVACLDGYRQDPGDDSLYLPIQVVDDEGVYVDATLSCENGEGTFGSEPSESLGTEPVEAARSFLTGLEPDDELARVGYVERPSEASVAVRRDGEVVAVLRLEPVKGGWGWFGFESCPEAGFSY
jgi:hypothetical protein